MSSKYTVNERSQRVAPQLRPAGLAGDYSEPKTADLLSSYNPASAVTPDKVKAYQHRGQEVGTAGRHYGRAGDVPADTTRRYGAKSDPSENIDGCLRPDMHADRMTVLLDEQREKAYSRRAPVGRAANSQGPAVEAPLDGFGRPTERGESAKQTLNAWKDAEVLHPAGEQTNRGYEWEAVGIDPTQHRFGQTNKSTGDSASAAMQYSGETALVPKIVKDYAATTKDELGKPRSYGFDDPAEWDDNKKGTARKLAASQRRLGEGTQGTTDATVHELLSQWAPGTRVNEASTTGGRKVGSSGGARAADEAPVTIAPEGEFADSERRMREGLRSVDARGRTVITLREMDDEATAQQLVNPSHYVTLGVESKYFAGGRDLEGVRALCHKCDFGLSDAQIDEVFAESAVNGKCGIEQFKNAAKAKDYL